MGVWPEERDLIKQSRGDTRSRAGTTIPRVIARAAAFAACALLAAPAHALDPARSIRQYAYDAWTPKDGLPDGAVMALHQTTDGYLWLGTQCCLVRYDGERFLPFEEGQLGLKQYSFGRDLLETRDGSLWAALVGGLARYSDGRFEFYDETRGLSHPFVYALAPGPLGSLWLGTGGTGVWQFADGAFTRHPAYALQPDLPSKVNDLHTDSQGTLWVASDGGVLELGSSVRRFTTSDGLPSPVANVLMIDKHGRLWVGTRHGLAHTSAEEGWHFVSEEGLASADVTALLEDRDENLWIGTRSGGLHRTNAGRIDQSDDAPAIANGGVYALAEDRDGAIWVGTGSGLERYRNGAFLTVGRDEGLLNDQILNVLVRREGGLWVLDGTGAVSIYEDRRTRTVAPPGTIPGDGMLGLLETDDGSLWVGGAELHRFRDGRWESYANPHGEITVVASDGPALMLSQTTGDGTSTLWHFIDGRFIPVPIDVPLTHVQCLYRDRSGRWWISTGGGGLVRFSANGTRVFRMADGLPHDVVYGVEEDDEKDLWVATRGGIARIRGDHVVSFADVPGMPRRSPVHVQLDGLGYLWATADDGIYRASVEALNALADGRAREHVAEKFTTRDGLRTVQISWRCSAQAKTPDGHLYYATSRGLSMIDPRLAETPLPAPSVRIDELWVGGRSVDPNRGVSIADGRERLDLRFSAPSLGAPDEVEFRYRLVGYDRDWVEAHAMRAAHYTSVPAGTYTFRVTARRSGGAWDGNEASLELFVEPRWYETVAARLALAGGLMLFLYGLYRIRVLQLKRTELTLVQRVAERTEELGREVVERRAAEEEVRRLNLELDGRVRERTAELESTNVALRRSEERYALAAQGANDGLWDWDVITGQTYFSPRWKAMLGYEAEEIGTGLDAWFSRVHPEDLPGLRRMLDARLSGASLQIRHEYRMLHRDSTELWVLCRGMVVLDARGRASRVTGSQTDITARKRAEADLRRSATHDALTGLPNRALLTDRLEQAVLRAQRSPEARFAVLFLDLDHFKTINDSLGHLVGDQLLIQIAHRLRACVRDVDTVARLGGDEFAIVVADAADEQQASIAAERIQEALRAPFEIGESRVFTSASIGITLSSASCLRAEDFLRDADTAMYRAKSQGRARHQMFDARMHEQAVERLEIEAGLRRALENDELVLHYQPILSLATGATVGAEALVRWKHPERGLLGPAAFLAIAAESGLIVPMSEWVVHAACEQARAWQRQLSQAARININMPPQLLNDPRLVERIRGHLHAAELPSSAIGIELVESSLVEGQASVIANLTELRAMGIHIAIDDFGTGYSSLSYLKRLPIDCLKIDRSFMQGVPWDANDTAICTTIVAMARSLNLEVVAEGVETREQADFLVRSGCVAAQGYHFSRPLPADECARFFEASRTGRSTAPSSPFGDVGVSSNTP